MGGEERGEGEWHEKQRVINMIGGITSSSPCHPYDENRSTPMHHTHYTTIHNHNHHQWLICDMHNQTINGMSVKSSFLLL
jgi:hypothetical protein